MNEELEEIVEELITEYNETKKPITKLHIGLLLRDYDLNTPHNMKEIVQKLKELNIILG